MNPVDVVFYYYYHCLWMKEETGTCMHYDMRPRFERLALLLEVGRPSTLNFSKIAVSSNDLPPPHGTFISRTSVMVYPAEKKLQPLVLEWMTPPKTLYDILSDLVNAVQAPESKDFLLRIYRHLGAEYLRAERWWEDEELMEHARKHEKAPPAKRGPEGFSQRVLPKNSKVEL